MRRLVLSFLIASSFPSHTFYAQENANIPEINGNYKKIKKNKSSKVIWTYIIDYNDTYKRNLIWEKLDDKELFDFQRTYDTLMKDNENKGSKIRQYDKINDNLYDKQIGLNLLNLGRSVPNAFTLRKEELQIKISQIVPKSKSYYIGGTGNQNYEGSINYGLTDSLMIEGFYAHSDDQLHKQVNNYDEPVANRWIIYGTSLRWQFMKNNDLLVALNSSIENWNIKSGGCNLYNCKYTTNNMFNDKKEQIINDNLVGSISLPINYKLTNKLDFSLVPSYIFLPSSQSNQLSSGKFYGSSFGFGTGIEYKLINNLNSYSSLYFPLSGSNSFDENLLFNRKTIYNAGLIYSLDTKISLEAGVTNGFGLSPSIGTLTLPSSDELLYKTSLIYRPSNLQLPSKKISKENRIRLVGLSVANAETLSSGEIYSSYYLNNNSSWTNKIVWGASNRFDFDFSISSIGQNLHTSKPFDGVYHEKDNVFIRGGGKAVFLSQIDGDFITSSARASVGRLQDGVGWIFAESVNTYMFNDNVSLNINPKASYSGIFSPHAIGTSLNWQIIKDISLIPEYNFALKESTDNWTIALRFSQFKNMNIDIFTTNSLNFIDTGQLLRSDTQSYGFNVGFIF